MDYLSIRKKEFPIASKQFAHPEMTKDYFLALADEFRSPHLWKKDGGTWVLRHTVWHEAEKLTHSGSSGHPAHMA